jgi:lysine 2,3-aminomutase
MQQQLDKIAISIRSHQLLNKLLKENPRLKRLLENSSNATEALTAVKDWVLAQLRTHPTALQFYTGELRGHEAFVKLSWSDYAAIRILDYIDHADEEFFDLNLKGEVAISNPIKQLWLAVHYGTGGAKPYFFKDMLHLFRQFSGKNKRKIPSPHKVKSWMANYPSGLEDEIIALRKQNQERIIKILIDKLDSGELSDSKYRFETGMSREQKFLQMLEWWNDSSFHLKFAVCSPDLLNEMLDFSLDPDTMKILYDAEQIGIPFFINPYYLSLLHVSGSSYAIKADLAIRDYVIYSRQLVNEFGQIIAWEKEDEVQPGKPNAAGWILPSYHNVHRRYPEVAILIPETTGRACGGLCAVCQRMYVFQKGIFNFNIDSLKADERWPQKLSRYMKYFENDSQLRDVLISGGDALMNSNKSLRQILDAVYIMACNKKKANEGKPEGKKYAELLRVRLGSRLPVYLPQRVTPKLVKILANFREKAAKIGVKQFVIQTHFVSPMEITPDVREAVRRLLTAGWIVTNQLVFTAAASRRGHTAKLRQVLNDIGVLPYYTFSVKGYMENNDSFTPNARSVQEQQEEKVLGKVPEKFHTRIASLPHEAKDLVRQLEELRNAAKLPFLATDRNVMNLPGVGKSLSFRVIGITRYGRRILEFNHDTTRAHSPAVKKMNTVVIIETKSISEYLRQLEEMGEDRSDYMNLYGYSMGETEPRMPIYEYPEYDFAITDKFTHCQIENEA